MYYSYCLFCETSKCKKVVSLLTQKGIDCAFSPQIVRRQRKKGVNFDVMFDLLPGYVFAFASSRVKDVSFFKVDGVIKLLGVPEFGFCLVGDDRRFAEGLLERNGLIGVLKMLRIGDNVKLVDEIFYGCEGKIVQIDYRKQRAKVIFTFAGSACTSWIACDVIDYTNILRF